MGRVATNCATTFYLRWMYTSNSSIPASLSASAIRGYSHPPSGRLFEIFPVILRTTRWRNPPRVRAMRGVTNHISDQNNRVTWTTPM